MAEGGGGFDRNTLIAEFRAEARRQLDDLDQALIAIEDHGFLDPDVRPVLLRSLHTLKGNAAMMGLQEVAEKVHGLENVFRDVERPIVDVDPLFEVSAAIRSVVERVGGRGLQESLEHLRRTDPRRARGSSPVTGSSVTGSPETRTGGEAGVQHASSAEVRPVGPFPRDDADERVSGRSAAKDTQASEVQDLVRVPFGKLDRLLTHVSELVTLGARLDLLMGTHRSMLEFADVYRDLREHAEDVAILAGRLRDATMDLRLVPLRAVLGRFPAVVRDLARSGGKRARVEIAGEAIELDKSAIDALGEPLMHLVRNAVDHGLEPPEVRARAGKDPVGTVWLRAQRSGDHILLEIGDNGSGLDRASILRRARELGLVSDDEHLTDDEVRDLIFAPGFSTRKQATTVSGRGVGLDIVRRGIAQLRGSLEVRDAKGGGTVFVLRLPLTLAIVSALIFEIEGEVFALAATDIRETLPRTTFGRAGGTEVVRSGEAMIPIAWPRRVFGWSESGAEVHSNSAESRHVIVISRGERFAAVPADRLIDQRDIVVKAMPRYLGSVPGVSGATVAPDGRVVLLLDSEELIDLNVRLQTAART